MKTVRSGNSTPDEPLYGDHQLRRAQAEIANERFMFALMDYGARYGLPNMTKDECATYRQRLQGYVC
jgi:hypothetical protein